MALSVNVKHSFTNRNTTIVVYNSANSSHSFLKSDAVISCDDGDHLLFSVMDEGYLYNKYGCLISYDPILSVTFSDPDDVTWELNSNPRAISVPDTLQYWTYRVDGAEEEDDPVVDFTDLSN